MNNTHWTRGALLLFLALVCAPTPVGAQIRTFERKDVPTESIENFAFRAKDLEIKRDWPQLLEVSRERRTAHPDEAIGWNAEALAAYALGDAAAAVAAWTQAKRLDPNFGDDERLLVAQRVRAAYPDHEFKPIENVEGEQSVARRQWSEKATALLNAKDYDELDRVAAQLQKSNESSVLGAPLLVDFFRSLSTLGDNADERRAAVEAWRAARPQSNLARFVEIDMLTNFAWLARGNGFSDSITPAMSAKMDESLSRAAQNIDALPATAVESPLLFITLQNWARLSGAGRSFLDAVFEEGSARFPDFNALYFDRAVLLQPRWFGGPGEIMAMVDARANQLGGEAGDMFYALGVANVVSGYTNVAEESPYDYARFARGMKLLRARNPDSVTLRTVDMMMSRIEAFSQDEENRDWEHVNQIYLEPEGQRFDQTWGAYRDRDFQMNHSAYRMSILSHSKPTK